MPNSTASQISHNGWRTQAMYSFSETAQLAGVSVRTVRRWLFGDAETQPLFVAGEADPMVSFLQLVEIMVSAKFRKAYNTRLQVVRSAYENARKLWRVEYPFAHLKLEPLGGHIVTYIESSGTMEGYNLEAIDEPGQLALPLPFLLAEQTVRQLVYESELAAKWYPVGRDIPIVVDPRISSGLPVVDGRGITVQIIHKRFKAGQRIGFIAQDFDLDEMVVEEIVRYGDKVVKVAA